MGGGNTDGNKINDTGDGDGDDGGDCVMHSKTDDHFAKMGWNEGKVGMNYYRTLTILWYDEYIPCPWVFIVVFMATMIGITIERFRLVRWSPFITIFIPDESKSNWRSYHEFTTMYNWLPPPYTLPSLPNLTSLYLDNLRTGQ